MRDGRLQQVDTPQVLYDTPTNEFVAGFIGSPAINLVEAQLERSNGNLTVSFGDYTLGVADQLARNRSALADYVGRTIILGIRPEDFGDATLASDVPSDRRLKVPCDLTEPLGSEILAYFTIAATGVVSSAHEHAEDASVHLGRNGGRGNTTRLVARVDPRSRIREGEEVELAVDTSRLYFFDPETREAV
jgi:multiple sugar transport system ATP-binding protein